MMRIFYYKFFWVAFICLLFSHITFAEAQTAKIKVYVTVDWEGATLENGNIETMQAFRKQFPYIPMLQLLNPAYFLRDHPNNAQLTSFIKSTFLPEDTQGLHVHAWKSLTNYCGVTYQHGHSFAGADEDCQTGDCGYTVSLEFAYTQADLTKLIACSSEVLVKNGFNQPVHFRAGGWQLGPKLTAALEENGFIWDSSKIDADLLTTRWHEDSGLVKMLRQLHPASTPLDQPYALSTKLMEYPNNAALADYTNTKQIVTLFENLLKANKKVMVLGFHQETAGLFLVHLEKAIPLMEAIAKKQNVQIEWVSK